MSIHRPPTWALYAVGIFLMFCAIAGLATVLDIVVRWVWVVTP